MSTVLDPATSPLAAAAAPMRLSLAPDGVRPGRLDGAWWPRSRDLLLEIPALAAELDARWGRVTRITVNPAQWPVIPRRIPVAGRSVHAGWFTVEQDEHMIMVCSYTPRRLDLLVVPPSTDPVEAARLMVRAADPANTCTASALLAEGAETASAPAGPAGPADAPEVRGSGFLPSAAAPGDVSGDAERRDAVARTRAATWLAPA
ncbi:DUF5994 family protein [Kitasatospora sp. NBC_01539]|uniref:DUF5994 family protein n=1 Tax=Kitasatospora sp. NBC_01539 TaxID=2903577 RepID=UPI0038602F33